MELVLKPLICKILGEKKGKTWILGLYVLRKFASAFKITG